jgi:hypothetical protein
MRALAWVVCAGVFGCNSVLGIEEATFDPTVGASGSGPGEGATLCLDTCGNGDWAGDGVCDDGGPGHDYAACSFGTDCSDCGVRTATDVVGATCDQDSDCSLLEGARCTDEKVCVKDCTTSEDCGCPAGTGETEIRSGACMASCVNRTDTLATCQRSCSSDSDCTGGDSCIGGTWHDFCAVAYSGACTVDSTCSMFSGATCDSSVATCTMSCSQHSDCGCDAGITDSDIQSGACTTPCSEGACRTSCGSDSDCPLGTWCLQGTYYGTCTRATPEIGSPCAATFQCNTSANDFCSNGMHLCARSCTTHDDCGCPAGLTDAQIQGGACPFGCDGNICVKVCSSPSDCRGAGVTCNTTAPGFLGCGKIE